MRQTQTGRQMDKRKDKQTDNYKDRQMTQRAKQPDNNKQYENI